MIKNYVKTTFLIFSPVPEKKKTKHDNEAKMKGIMILPGISSIGYTCIHVLANLYMSVIFSSLNILVQTQLGPYLYRPTSVD